MPEAVLSETPIDEAREAEIFRLRGEETIFDLVEIVGTREGGLIDCMVPTELIDHEEVPVKEEWAQSLAEQMRQIADEEGGTGQLMPITLGMIEGEDRLKIVDGFHRDAALKMNGVDTVFATIKAMDWDTLYDYRIFTAKDHAHVRFSRVVQWIREVWSYSGLSDQLDVEQAVILYRYGGDGSRLDLSPDDVSKAKEWVQRKEEQWGIKSMTIHSHLKIAESVDPVLVHSTREKANGRELKAPTQNILKIFADQIPGNQRYQNLIMDAAIERNLKGPEVKALCIAIKDINDPEEAAELIASIDWDTWEPEYGDTTKRARRRAHDPRQLGAKVFRPTTDNLRKITERVEQSLEKDEEITAEARKNLAEAQREVNELVQSLGRLSTMIAELQGEATAPVSIFSNTNGHESVESVQWQVDTYLRSLDQTRTMGSPLEARKSERRVNDLKRALSDTREMKDTDINHHNSLAAKFNRDSLTARNLRAMSQKLNLEQGQVLQAILEAMKLEKARLK